MDSAVSVHRGKKIAPMVRCASERENETLCIRLGPFVSSVQRWLHLQERWSMHDGPWKLYLRMPVRLQWIELRNK